MEKISLKVYGGTFYNIAYWSIFLIAFWALYDCISQIQTSSFFMAFSIVILYISYLLFFTGLMRDKLCPNIEFEIIDDEILIKESKKEKRISITAIESVSLKYMETEGGFITEEEAYPSVLEIRAKEPHAQVICCCEAKYQKDKMRMLLECITKNRETNYSFTELFSNKHLLKEVDLDYNQLEQISRTLWTKANDSRFDRRLTKPEKVIFYIMLANVFNDRKTRVIGGDYPVNKITPSRQKTEDIDAQKAESDIVGSSENAIFITQEKLSEKLGFIEKYRVPRYIEIKETINKELEIQTFITAGAESIQYSELVRLYTEHTEHNRLRRRSGEKKIISTYIPFLPSDTDYFFEENSITICNNLYTLQFELKDISVFFLIRNKDIFHFLAYVENEPDALFAIEDVSTTKNIKPLIEHLCKQQISISIFNLYEYFPNIFEQEVNKDKLRSELSNLLVSESTNDIINDFDETCVVGLLRHLDPNDESLVDSRKSLKMLAESKPDTVENIQANSSLFDRVRDLVVYEAFSFTEECGTVEFNVETNMFSRLNFVFQIIAPEVKRSRANGVLLLNDEPVKEIISSLNEKIGVKQLFRGPLFFYNQISRSTSKGDLKINKTIDCYEIPTLDTLVADKLLADKKTENRKHRNQLIKVLLHVLAVSLLFLNFILNEI